MIYNAAVSQSHGYLDSSGRKLCCVLHREPAASMPTGVVICNPFGDEQIRAHYALWTLAQSLAEAGIPALRFDYSGTGDSAGQTTDALLSQWVYDAVAAATYIRQEVGCLRVDFIGLRLGAYVAHKAANELQKFASHQVLWAPVVDGRNYVRTMEAADSSWYSEGLAKRRPVSPGVVELGGMRFSAHMVSQLRAVRLLLDSFRPCREVLVVDESTNSESQEPGDEIWQKRRVGAEGGLARLRVVRSVVKWLITSREAHGGVSLG